jgi:hypothetical protein
MQPWIMFYVHGISIKGLMFIIVVISFSNVIYVHIIPLYLLFNMSNTDKVNIILAKREQMILTIL